MLFLSLQLLIVLRVPPQVIVWLLILSIFTSYAEFSFTCPCELKGSWGSNWKSLDGLAWSGGFLKIGGFPKPAKGDTIWALYLLTCHFLRDQLGGRSSMAEAVCFFLPSQVPLKTCSLGKKYFDGSLNWGPSAFEFISP